MPSCCLIYFNILFPIIGGTYVDSIHVYGQWQMLEMTKVERRKTMCSVTFHAIAITCVVWSLYVLIERTSDEIREGALHWPFWTKLIVVAIGFTGGVVFMYVQCKMYVRLCQRWRAFNRVVYVQNRPLDWERAGSGGIGSVGRGRMSTHHPAMSSAETIKLGPLCSLDRETDLV